MELGYYKAFFACIHLNSRYLVGCYHSGTEGRTTEQGKIELLSQWTKDSWDEQKKKLLINDDYYYVSQWLKPRSYWPFWQIKEICLCKPTMVTLLQQEIQDKFCKRIKVKNKRGTPPLRESHIREVGLQKLTWIQWCIVWGIGPSWQLSSVIQ